MKQASNQVKSSIGISSLNIKVKHYKSKSMMMVNGDDIPFFQHLLPNCSYKCVEYFLKTKSELARYSNKQTEIVLDRFLSFVVRQ